MRLQRPDQYFQSDLAVDELSPEFASQSIESILDGDNC